LTYRSLIILTAISAACLAAWAYTNQPQPMPDWTGGPIAGISYTPYGASQNPVDGDLPTAAMIDKDLDLLSGQTRAIRTYSAEGVMGDIATLAHQKRMRVLAGAWLGRDEARNLRETEALISLARQNRNIRRVLVGNESLLRKDVTPVRLISAIKYVRRLTNLQVSTAETWDIWLAHPELAKAVDFLGVQILPYWEGVPADAAVEYTLSRVTQLRETYPDKPIVLTEIGWPSEGRKIKGAEAGLLEQARFLREFVNAASARGLDYYVIEAFDQPWKIGQEGMAGGYWGLFDADRAPKVAWQGPMMENPNWFAWALAAVLLGFVPAGIYILRRPTLRPAGAVMAAILSQASATLFVVLLMSMAALYLTTFQAVLWVLLLVAACVLLSGLFIDGAETSDLLWNGAMRRQFGPARSTSKPRKVSVHVAICKEPPEMVRRTLSALAALDYPDYEVIVVDNNTPDPALWQPVEQHCERLGERFRFIHREKLAGFKAGALNLALAETAPDAEVIAVIDSDYVVASDWLSDLVPHFDDPTIGIVQAPQDYSDLNENSFKSFCYWEYAGFFHLGMVRRNEANAIIQHGTMTMVRRTALQEVNGWAEWCITEDAELGLCLASLGWKSAYTPESYGKGVMPDTMRAYKKQRFRWAYGAIQIMKRHWRWFLTGGGTRLTIAQRFHYVAGWLPWLTDAAGLVFTLVALGWTVALLLLPNQTVPPAMFLYPALAAFLFRQWRILHMYRRKVPCTARQRWGGALAGLALSHTVASAVLQGLVTSGRPYQRTPKKRQGPQFFQALAMTGEESLMLALLTAAMVAFAMLRETLLLEDWLWMAVLAVMTLPYLAAVSLAMVNAMGGNTERDTVAAGLLNLVQDASAQLSNSAGNSAASRSADQRGGARGRAGAV
jgi:cellulose synthase/poly-beta-1,6-N-acetylglucosamine synthase-like glycosyltransferase/exo-beta-1,3-glucanase (GH17 family)